MNEYLIVDGYNIINNWDELKNESEVSLESARAKLLEIMSDYQAYRGIKVIVVFDAHYVKNSMEKHEFYNGVEVVYTKELESADNYIEKYIAGIAKDNHVTVATSDWIEQIVVFGLGAARISARELKLEIEKNRKKMNEKYISRNKYDKNLIEHSLNPKVREYLEKWRRDEQ